MESIIEGIREVLGEAGAPAPEGLQEAAEGENDLLDNLRAANEVCAAGWTPPGGVRGVFYRCAIPSIRRLVEDINAFHVRTVRVLNKLVRMLTGNDTPTDSDLLAQTKRRIDLLAQVGRRLDAIEDTQIERRLRRIEERLGLPPEQDET